MRAPAVEIHALLTLNHLSSTARSATEDQPHPNMNMKKQWRGELRTLKRHRAKIEKDLARELKRLQREIIKLQRAGIRANNASVKAGRKLDRRIAILEGRLS